MDRVTQLSSARQAPLMPIDPRDQIRERIAGRIVPQIAELILQHDKPSSMMRLVDLRDEAEQAVYIAEALELLSVERRGERTIRLNALRAQTFAQQDDEQEMVERQARQDVIRFSDPVVAAFLRTDPRTCPICRTPIRANEVDVLVTESIRGKAHGACCANNGRRFEFVNEFTYQLIGGAK